MIAPGMLVERSSACQRMHRQTFAAAAMLSTVCQSIRSCIHSRRTRRDRALASTIWMGSTISILAANMRGSRTPFASSRAGILATPVSSCAQLPVAYRPHTARLMSALDSSSSSLS